MVVIPVGNEIAWLEDTVNKAKDDALEILLDDTESGKMKSDEYIFTIFLLIPYSKIFITCSPFREVCWKHPPLASTF